MQRRNKRKVFARKIQYSETKWFEQYKQFAQDEPYHVLLESKRGGRYSIIGLHPFAILKGKQHTLTITMDGKEEVQKGNPLHLMKKWMKTYRTTPNPDYPDFQGGAIGFISYDYVRHIENIPELAQDDLNTPDLYFLIFDDIFVFDHHEHVLWLITNDVESNEQEADQRLKNYEERWKTNHIEKTVDEKFHYTNTKQTRYLSMTEDEFIKAVKRVQEYIANGDVFQVNLSVRETQELQTSPMHIYKKLRSLNPSPYMGYLQSPDFQVICGSPELLIKKKGNELSTRPIAGTRSRGRNTREDQELANEMIQNEKEQAEHVMLVDLERNDLGRVSRYGTVEVDEFMVIEKYSHVMHIVSNVKGQIEDGYDVYDVIEAVFPGGTITGAPKVRTIEIIEELENVRRGIYTGSIGWIGFNGDMELNIVIRTMLVKDGMVHVQAGAGIVIDSNPKAEYKECLKKAKALWRAKELSEQELEEKVKVEQR